MFPLRTTLSVVGLVLVGLLMAGCSTVKLAYNQAPQLLSWQLNRYLDLTQPQAERVRDELADLHRWHRDTLLPEHAGLLQKLRQQLPAPMTAEQACRAYADLRTQIDQLLARAEPSLVWLASDLSEAQIRSLQKKQADSNADWKKEWLDPPPDKLREHRYQLLLSRAEDFYGTLQEPQKAALRRYIIQSSFDPQRTYAERQRRQQDLVQVLRKIAEERGNTDQARTLLRGYLARLNTSPDAAYQRYAATLVDEGCAGFALVHSAMTPAQRLQAVAAIGAYEQDFITLAAQRVAP
jgi:small-conductance mechanosensitive channel